MSNRELCAVYRQQLNGRFDHLRKAVEIYLHVTRLDPHKKTKLATRAAIIKNAIAILSRHIVYPGLPTPIHTQEGCEKIRNNKRKMNNFSTPTQKRPRHSLDSSIGSISPGSTPPKSPLWRPWM